MAALSDKHIELTRLFNDALAGNTLSYNQFLHTITPIMRRLVAKKLPVSDSEDVVQEILISIHKSRHTYDGHRPIMPWLFAIARFRIQDYLRKYYVTGHNRTLNIDDLAECLADVTISTDSNESYTELINDLPERDKRILSLMHVEGYTAKETGTKLDMKESAVKVAAHRAIKKLKEKLGKKL